MEQSSDQPGRPQTELADSPRFAPEKTRRDWLGFTAFWSAMAGFIVATIGALRLPMPAVFPESKPQVKIGPPETYKPGSATHLRDLGLWLFRDDDGGMYAISSICTHLGCIAGREENGEFTCPCHGSVFKATGEVVSGPAPSGLNWAELSIAPDGQVVVDKMRTVDAGTRLMV